MLQIPIFHVNGEDPEAVAQVVSLAMDFRKEFHRDVVIDLYAFRRWGHNEGDEPRFTQPRMYAEIDRRASRSRTVSIASASTRQNQSRRSRTDPTRANRETGTRIRSQQERSLRSRHANAGGELESNTSAARNQPNRPTPRLTGNNLSELLDSLTRLPNEFSANKKLKRPMAQRREMAAGKRPLDWAAAEAAAFASLLVEGHPIRMTGQDCERGTFSHRHAVLHDTKNGSTYTPLKHLQQRPSSPWNFTTARSAKPACWDLSMAIRWICPMV